MVISEEVAALRADLERLQREVRAIKAANREYKAELYGDADVLPVGETAVIVVHSRYG